MMTNDDRNAVIEECARRLIFAAAGFIELANDSGSRGDIEERDNAYSLAHAYTMAAREVRMMDERNAEAHQRNLNRISTWLRGKKKGPLPEIEPARPPEH